MARGRKVYDEEEEEEEGERPEYRCRNCQYFDADRQEEELTDEEVHPCVHPDLEEYDLMVSGDSGCNLFEQYDEAEEEEDEDEDEEEEEEEVY